MHGLKLHIHPHSDLSEPFDQDWNGPGARLLVQRFFPFSFIVLRRGAVERRLLWRDGVVEVCLEGGSGILRIPFRKGEIDLCEDGLLACSKRHELEPNH